MEQKQLIPHLFRNEYSRITTVLCKLFGIEHIEIAEDIASDTFLAAMETWGHKGLPENPTAWLYTVAKNKALNFLKREQLFQQKIKQQLTPGSEGMEELYVDLSKDNITDSQLQMMFAICHPSIPSEAQIGLSLRILCGFGIEEIAGAFLTNKETIQKRLARGKEKLRAGKVSMILPPAAEMNERLQNVLTTLYLLFNEGYYSRSQDLQLRKDLCLEAMRLTWLLAGHAPTNQPAVNALLSLMCFQSSRFEARMNATGEIVLYEEQDEALWNQELIDKGNYFLVQAATGKELTKYHLEAAIAYWHTFKAGTTEKWKNILQLYNQLLLIEYSPAAALNRTYALAMAHGKEQAIVEAEKLKLENNHLYHALLGTLYSGIDATKALQHFRLALTHTRSAADHAVIIKKMQSLVKKA